MTPPVSDLLRPWQGSSFDVFVSYCHKDADVALHLTSRLRSSGFSVFIDDDLPGGTPLARRIDAALEQAGVVLLVWSKAAKESNSVLGEVDAAKEAGTLLPVSIDDAPFSTWFRALKVRPLVRDGIWDEKCFQELRRDVHLRCGRKAPAERGSFVSPVARDIADTGVGKRSSDYSGRSEREEPPATSRDPSHPVSEPIRMAIVHAIQALRVSGAWLLNGAPPMLVVKARKYASEWPGDPIGLVDLVVPGVADAFLIIWADRLELATRDGQNHIISFDALISNPIEVVDTKYGYRASFRVGGDVLPVRGKSQIITLLYDALHSVREELTWLVRT
jgi:hypothetical protein